MSGVMTACCWTSPSSGQAGSSPRLVIPATSSRILGLIPGSRSYSTDPICSFTAPLSYTTNCPICTCTQALTLAVSVREECVCTVLHNSDPPEKKHHDECH